MTYSKSATSPWTRYLTRTERTMASIYLNSMLIHRTTTLPVKTTTAYNLSYYSPSASYPPHRTSHRNTSQTPSSTRPCSPRVHRARTAHTRRLRAKCPIWEAVTRVRAGGVDGAEGSVEDFGGHVWWLIWSAEAGIRIRPGTLNPEP